MSIIAAVHHGDRVILAADRAAVRLGEELVPGLPRPEHGQSKLLTCPAGITVAVAGVSRLAGRIWDLRHDQSDVLALALSPEEAVLSVARVFRALAASVRAGAPAPGPALQPLEEPADCVALVAGPTDAGPSLHIVGLMLEGPPAIHAVRRGGVGFGPAPVARDIELAVTDAAGQASEQEAVQRLGQLIVYAAGRQIGLVSPDWEYVIMGADGWTSTYVPAPPPQLPRH